MPSKSTRIVFLFVIVFASLIAAGCVGVGCYQWALSLHGTGLVLPVVALTPLVIIPFSRFVEGEKPGARSLLGGLIAVAGVLLLQLQATR